MAAHQGMAAESEEVVKHRVLPMPINEEVIVG
jgi:hypothetical protein